MKEEEVSEMLRRTLEGYGCIDILANNAGINVLSSIAEMSIKRWVLIMSVNLRSTFLCIKAVLPFMMN